MNLKGTFVEPQPAERHLRARLVAAYLEDQLAPEERDQVEGHLASCMECRQEVVSVGRLLVKHRRIRVLVPGAGLAAAAMLALVVGISLVQGPANGDFVAPVRTPALPADIPLQVVEPDPGSSLPFGQDIRFVWNGADAGATYKLTVVDESGGPVWSTETGDTVATLPAQLGLSPGSTYYWFVDALLYDGSAQTSGARNFTLR